MEPPRHTWGTHVLDDYTSLCSNDQKYGLQQCLIQVVLRAKHVNAGGVTIGTRVNITKPNMVLTIAAIASTELVLSSSDVTDEHNDVVLSALMLKTITTTEDTEDV